MTFESISSILVLDIGWLGSFELSISTFEGEVSRLNDVSVSSKVPSLNKARGDN